MPHVFSDSPNKKVVREQWNTPLLRHLHDNHGYRYRYFGLPGPDIIDIKLWQDMIDEVVAFEVPAKNGKDKRTYINKLRRNLEVLGIRNRTYYGHFEEVVLLGKDFDGQEYAQNNVITLYNLDFCSEIGSPIESSTGERLYRLEAIRQVIRDQRECYNRFHNPSYFIILLTVRNQMNSRFLIERLNACRSHWPEFIGECEMIRPVPLEDVFVLGTHSWALKTVIHFVFNQSLSGNNINALFFPLVKYTGVRTRAIPSPMLHLMVFCKFQPPYTVGGVSLPDNPLLTKSLTVSSSSLALLPEPGESVDPNLSSVAYFESFRARIL